MYGNIFTQLFETLDCSVQVTAGPMWFVMEAMTYLMDQYTGYQVLIHVQHNLRLLFKANSFKTDSTGSRQARVKKEDLVPMQVRCELLTVLASMNQTTMYKNIRQQSINYCKLTADT